MLGKKISENTFNKVLLYKKEYPAILVYKIKVFFMMVHSVLTVAFSVLCLIQNNNDPEIYSTL